MNEDVSLCAGLGQTGSVRPVDGPHAEEEPGPERDYGSQQPPRRRRHRHGGGATGDERTQGQRASVIGRVTRWCVNRRLRNKQLMWPGRRTGRPTRSWSGSWPGASAWTSRGPAGTRCRAPVATAARHTHPAAPRTHSPHKVHTQTHTHTLLLRGHTPLTRYTHIFIYIYIYIYINIFIYIYTYINLYLFIYLYIYIYIYLYIYLYKYI